MWPDPQFPADLVTFTEEILNGKLYFFAVFLSLISYLWNIFLKKYLQGNYSEWHYLDFRINFFFSFSYHRGVFNQKKLIESYAKIIARFFIKNTFISNARLKLAKNQANAKQHPEAELLLFENYSQPSKTNRTYSKK